MGIAEFIIGRAEGRTRWLRQYYIQLEGARLSAARSFCAVNQPADQTQT